MFINKSIHRIFWVQSADIQYRTELLPHENKTTVRHVSLAVVAVVPSRQTVMCHINHFGTLDKKTQFWLTQLDEYGNHTIPQ